MRGDAITRIGQRSRMATLPPARRENRIRLRNAVRFRRCMSDLTPKEDIGANVSRLR